MLSAVVINGLSHEWGYYDKLQQANRVCICSLLKRGRMLQCKFEKNKVCIYIDLLLKHLVAYMIRSYFPEL